MIQKANNYLNLFDKRIYEYKVIYEKLENAINRYNNDTNFNNELELRSIIAYIEQVELVKLSAIKNNEVISKKDLIIYINKEWKAFEFDRVFKSIDFLNKLLTIEDKLYNNESRINKGETREYIYKNAKLYHYLAPSEELKVKQIQYSSPGFINFRGSERIVSRIIDLVEKIITLDFIIKIVNNFDQLRHNRPINIQKDKNNLYNAIKKAEIEAIELEGKRLNALNKLNEIEYKIITKRINQIKETCANLIEISDLIENMDAKKIANKEILEQQIIQTLSSLYNLGFETEKIHIHSGKNES